MPAFAPLGCVLRQLLPRRIVDLVEQIQVLILAEDVADVGHVLLAVAHQRESCLSCSAARCEASTIELILSGAFFRSGSVMSAIERAHAAGLVFAHHKFELILARRQVEARRVLDILLPRLQRRIEIELDGFAHAADGPLHLVDHRADDVERGLVLVAAFDERNLRAGHEQRDRHVVAILIEAEVHGVEIDGDVGGGQIAGQLLVQFAARDLLCRSA